MALPNYASSQFQEGRKLREQYQQVGGLVHSNYLINLSKPTSEIQLQIDSVINDFEIASELGFAAVNVHIGKLKGFETRDEAMKNMVMNVKKILKSIEEKGCGHIQFLFENTAGQ